MAENQKKPIENDLAGVTDVEIKVTVSENREHAAEKAFKLDPRTGEIRHIFFFDTRDLRLFNNGVILRARNVKGGKDDSTIKIRPVDPKQIVEKWRRLDGFKVEADGVGAEFKPSASFSVEQDGDEIKAVVRGDRGIDKLFSKKQEEFLAEMSKVDADFASLLVLGPVDALRWKFDHPGLSHAITAENWTLPDRRDLLELSIKVPSAQARTASAAFNVFLKGLDLEPKGGQQTKTKAVLEFFAGRQKGK